MPKSNLEKEIRNFIAGEEAWALATQRKLLNDGVDPVVVGRLLIEMGTYLASISSPLETNLH